MHLTDAMITAAMARQDEQRNVRAKQEEQAAKDPVRRAGAEYFAERQAAETAERDRRRAEHLATERAAGAVEAASVQARITAELQRIGTPEADLSRLTADAMDQWRTERAV